MHNLHVNIGALALLIGAAYLGITFGETVNVNMDGECAYWQIESQPASSVSPGFSGAQPKLVNSTTIAWQLDATNEYVYQTVLILQTFPEVEDVLVHVVVALDGAETANDIIQMEIVSGTFGKTDNAGSPRTQTRTIDRSIGNRNAEGDRHDLHFALDYDAVGGEVRKGDILTFRFRLDSVAGGTDVAGVSFINSRLVYRTCKPAPETRGIIPSEG